MAKSGTILLKIAERLRPIYYGTCTVTTTGGYVTGIVDEDRTEPNNFFNGGTIFLLSGGGAGNTYQVVTYTASTHTFVPKVVIPSNAGTTVETFPGVSYGVIDKKYSRDVLLQALNMALSEIGPYTKLNTDLCTVQGQEAYTLPEGVYNVVRVQISEDENGEEWERPHRYWMERDGVLWFDDAYLPDRAGRIIRVYYETPHPAVLGFVDEVTDAIHPDVIASLGAINALRQRIVTAGTSDPEPNTLLQMLMPQYQALKAAHPVRRMMKDARYPVLIPSSPVGDTRPAPSVTPTPTGDTSAPTTPTGLLASGVTSTEIVLSWTESTDNVGVQGYWIYRDGVNVGGTTVASWTDSGLTSSTSYTYEVAAYDAAGNVSSRSNPLVQTTAADPADTTPPSIPGSLTVGTITATSIAMSWSASTDDTAVVYYTVYRDGAAIANPTGTSYTDRLVTPSTTYEYTVDAVDAAGNHSQLSNAITPTSSAATGDTFYVSTTGSASNPGTIDEPFTLAYALNGAAGGAIGQDDVVYIRGGTYNLSATQVVSGLNGASSHRITIRAYPGERVTIRNAYSTAFNTFQIRTNDYVDFIGLEFTAYQYSRITASNTAVDMAHIYLDPAYTIDHIRIIDCRFHDSPGKAIRVGVNATNTEIEGCHFYYNGSGPKDWTMQIHGATSSNTCVRKNVFIHNAADDVRIFSDTAGSQALENIDIDDNVFLSTGSLYSDPAVSILIGGETDTAKNITVDNNVVYNRQAADGNSRAYQLGGVGVITPGTHSNIIASSADDGTYAADGTWKNNGTHQVGQSGGALQRGAFYRFINVDIPQGAHITSAVLTVNVNNTDATDTIDTRIRAVDEDDATTITSYADRTGRSVTTEYACWTIGPAWTTGDINSPDFSNVLQEIVDRPGWDNNQAIVLVWDDDDSSDDIWITDRAHSTTICARLSVTFETQASDGGANTVSASGNRFVGQPVDLSHDGYTSVTFSSNTVVFPGSHVGDTEADYASNTWTHAYPSTQSTVLKVYDYNTRIANLLVLNYPNASTVTVSASDLSGLTLSSGDSYILCNLENYYTDRITGIYNGSSISIPMTGRTQASQVGFAPRPATLYPTVGIFQIITGTGPGGGNVPPSVPQGLEATAGSSSVQLTWLASSGPSLAGYSVYRDGQLLGTTTSRTFTDSGLAPGQTYSYAVDAYDSLGNHSARSDSVSATTVATGKFVSVTGLATNAGTLAAPWSLNYAIQGAGGAIVPGTVIWLRGGTYQITGTINFGASGTAAQPIEYRAYPGERVTIRMNYTYATQLYFNGVSHVHLFDIEFTGQGYSRVTEQPQGTYEHAIGGWTSGGVGNKLYGCHIKNAATHGWRAFEQSGDAEFNGCLIEFNGSNNQYDHGVYIRGVDNTLPQTFKNCIVAHNASHGFHGWGSGDKPEKKLRYIGNLVFQNGSLYDAATRQMLIGGTGTNSADSNTVSDNVTYTNLGVDGNADAFRLGYGGGHNNNRVEGNTFVGSPVYIDGEGTGDVFLNNTLYYGSGSGSQRGSTATVMNAGTGNTMAAIPGSGLTKHIRTYDWDSRRANIGLLNFDNATSVTLTHADLVSAGLTIAAGNTYELHNAENYYGDVITGIYNGSSIIVPMTGRTVETPYGLPKPSSSFPTFGAFIIRTRTGA